MKARDRFLRSIAAIAEEQGWTLEKSGSDHWRFVPPKGATGPDGNLIKPVYTGQTPSDTRGDKNMIASLRRAGIDVPRHLRP